MKRDGSNRSDKNGNRDFLLYFCFTSNVNLDYL